MTTKPRARPALWTINKAEKGWFVAKEDLETGDPLPMRGQRVSRSQRPLRYDQNGVFIDLRQALRKVAVEINERDRVEIRGGELVGVVRR